MQKKFTDTAKTVIILLLLILGTRMLVFLPWWSFVIPVIIMGLVITSLRWSVPVFLSGFTAGFIVWFGAYIYFDAISNVIILYKLGHLMHVSKGVVMLMSSLIGGLLTGIALYTGKSIVLKEEIRLNM